MNYKFGLLGLFAVVTICGCSAESDQELNSFISGRITVDEELDSSANNSGIELLVSNRDTSGESQDTVFHAVTDVDGYFSGTAQFEVEGVYPVMISRNRNLFGALNIVFADGDSVTINGELPDLNETIEINSAENEVFETYNRIDRNFNRVAMYINAGAISQDSIGIEIQKWSDIFWQVYKEHPGTYGAKISGETSVSLLRGWNDSLMLARNEELLENIKTPGANLRRTLMNYYADAEGLSGVLSFLDRIEESAEKNHEIMEINMERIELLYDSSRTTEATRFLNEFKNKYEDNASAMSWAEDISYDLEVLSPGAPFPEITFQTLEGDSLSISDMEGTPFLLEITRLDNSMYQQQYDRTVAIHQIYRNFGLDIITIPLGANDIVVQAFFQERGLLWTVAQPNSFDGEQLIEQLNINRVPTRFLVDDDGNIIRRYIGNEYDEVVQGLQQILTQQQP